MPAAGVAPPARERDVFAERRKLRANSPISVEHERRAVEHQFVLAADHVEVDQRQPGIDDARHRDVQTMLRLAAPVRRAVRHQQDFAARLAEAFDDFGTPDVLADRNADPHALDQNRARHRTRLEHAFLVEHAVVRQIDLEAHRLDHAAAEQHIGVVELAVLDPWRADQHAGPLGALARQRLDGGAAGRLERRLEHQVFRRIAGQNSSGNATRSAPSAAA